MTTEIQVIEEALKWADGKNWDDEICKDRPSEVLAQEVRRLRAELEEAEFMAKSAKEIMSASGKIHQDDWLKAVEILRGALDRDLHDMPGDGSMTAIATVAANGIHWRDKALRTANEKLAGAEKALREIKSIQVVEVDGGDMTYSREAKMFCAAFGKAICIARDALADDAGGKDTHPSAKTGGE